MSPKKLVDLELCSLPEILFYNPRPLTARQKGRDLPRHEYFSLVQENEEIVDYLEYGYGEMDEAPMFQDWDYQ